MQIRIFLLLMCFGSLASAQVFQTNNTPYKFKGIKTDSMMVIPSGPDTVRLPSPKWGESMVGALFFRTTDSTLWGRSANKWNKLSGGGASIDTTSLSNRINAKVDKSTTLTINGTTYDLSANRSWTIATGDTTGIGDLYIRNLATPQENKRFNVKAGRLDSLYASTSAGGRIVTNTGTTVAQWGAGGGSEFDFHGFAGYNANRAASYTVRSFTDKNYVDSAVAAGGTTYTSGNGIKIDGSVIRWADTVAASTEVVAVKNQFGADYTAGVKFEESTPGVNITLYQKVSNTPDISLITLNTGVNVSYDSASSGTSKNGLFAGAGNVILHAMSSSKTVRLAGDTIRLQRPSITFSNPTSFYAPSTTSTTKSIHWARSTPLGISLTLSISSRRTRVSCHS
jgi:hypothetical protein